MAAAGDGEPSRPMSIYRASRDIKRRDNSLYNALRSIYDDSVFVAEIAGLWPDLPLVANLRCGLWYSPRFVATCYFKSTDGHTGNWAFSTARLNLHAAKLAGQRGGCIIIDSTRKGKRFPDSMSKTIPIWACVLNRAIEKRLWRMHAKSPQDGELDSNCSSDGMEHISLCWDSSLHLPVWVPNTEKAIIEDRLEEWSRQLESCGADIDSIVSFLKKPLRPLWISQKTLIWLNEVPDYDSWDFTPIILVSASAPNGLVQRKTTSKFSWHYIPGAGDDEESWARGLTPNLFWKHAFDLIDCEPDLCNQRVNEIIEKDRVYRSLRGEVAPQFIVKSQKLLESNSYFSNKKSHISCQLTNFDNFKNFDGIKTFPEEHVLSWIGSTNLAVGTTSDVAKHSEEVDCVLNCDSKLISFCSPSADACLHLPIVTSKLDKFSLMNSLPSAISFAKLNLNKGKKLLVCCNDGEDISVCVCLAMLTALFDKRGTFDDEKFFMGTRITKLEMRNRLVYICKFAVNARPCRGNLRQVFAFLSREREGSDSDGPIDSELRNLCWTDKALVEPSLAILQLLMGAFLALLLF